MFEKEESVSSQTDSMKQSMVKGTFTWTVHTKEKEATEYGHCTELQGSVIVQTQSRFGKLGKSLYERAEYLKQSQDLGYEKEMTSSPNKNSAKVKGSKDTGDDFQRSSLGLISGVNHNFPTFILKKWWKADIYKGISFRGGDKNKDFCIIWIRNTHSNGKI